MKNGIVFANSRDVAAFFGKLHKNVLQAIDNLECSEEFARLNFQPSEYIDATGRTVRSVNMTKDGFTFLVMGFTGKEAARFKEAYIRRFNEMEQALKQQAQAQTHAIPTTFAEALRLAAEQEASSLCGKPVWE